MKLNNIVPVAVTVVILISSIVFGGCTSASPEERREAYEADRTQVEQVVAEELEARGFTEPLMHEYYDSGISWWNYSLGECRLTSRISPALWDNVLDAHTLLAKKQYAHCAEE